MSGASCDLGVAWLIAAFLVGMSFGACFGGVAVALSQAAGKGNSPPRIPTGPVSRETVDMTRLDVDRWYDHATKALSNMRRGLE